MFNADQSLLSICPHMHLLGKSYKVWMETPAGDSIPLIDIPHWDFEWQFYYRFLSPVHVPAGTVFKTEGVYDNTVWNPLNPNDPPQEVTYGSLTTDEMFLVYFIWAAYQEGDEELVFGTVDEEVDAVAKRCAPQNWTFKFPPTRHAASGSRVEWFDAGASGGACPTGWGCVDGGADPWRERAAPSMVTKAYVLAVRARGQFGAGPDRVHGSRAEWPHELGATGGPGSAAPASHRETAQTPSSRSRSSARTPPRLPAGLATASPMAG